MQHPNWPAPRPLTDEERRAWDRYDALTPAEKDRARRLVALTGASLTLAVAAVEATRARP